MEEREIKLRMSGPEAARAAVARVGGKVSRGRHFEDNALFDDGAGRLNRAGCVLRLRRRDPGPAALTFKGEKRVEDGVRSRPEMECEVADADAVQSILAGLGYEPRFRYQKFRESYAWRDAEIEIDETPIGTFVEIEGPISTIHAAAEALGRGPGDYITDSYVGLFLAQGGTGDMVFPQEMKAMVLAAGLGLRMRPLTTLRAKPALPVLNRPLMAWTLERLGRHGFKDIIVNTHHLPASVRDAARAARGLGLRVTFCHEPRILGTGGGPRRVRHLLGPGPVLLVNGDVFFDFDLRALVRRHRASGAAATLALKPNPKPSVYGPVVTATDGRVRSIAGLPRRARGRVSLFTGVHVVESSLLDRLGAGFSDSVRELYAPMVAAGERLLGVRVRGAWHDLGDPSLYLGAQMKLLPRSRRGLVDATASVEKGALISRSVIGAGCRVGAGARISGSVLWARVTIGAGARVRGSVLATGVRVAAGGRMVGSVGIPSRKGPLWSRL